MVGRWPLVGRDDELTTLHRLLDGQLQPGGPRGAAVFGEPGVGKTRLVSEAVAARQDEGATVEWVRATEAARQIALGSFAHLLAPGDGAHQLGDLLHLVLTRLRERTGERRFLLAIDDAHLLDDASIALLHLAVTQSPIRVLISVRTGEPLPPGLVGLWKDELLARLDVGPLSRDATERLVLAVLGDRVPPSLLDRIWRLSRGNVLFVRELVTAAVERREGGAGGPVVLSPEGPQQRLRELVEERLRLLDPGQRAALEIVAVGEQVPLEALQRLADSTDIEALEQRGLVEITRHRTSGGRGRRLGDSPQASTPRGDAGEVGDEGMALVQVAHPLYGEVLAGTLPRLRRWAVLRDLAGAVEGLDHFDRLRQATWRLESGKPGDPSQLLLLAREALGRLDHRLAERLARAAGGVDRADAGLVVAEALSGQGRTGEAEAVLAQLQPGDPAQRAQVAVARATDLFLYLQRSQEAFAVLHEAIDELEGHPDGQAECRSVLAQMLFFTLRPAEAGEIATDLLTTAGLAEPARVRAVMVAATVWATEGRLDEALALLSDDLYAMARRHRRSIPYGDIQLRMARYLVLFWSGRVRELDAFTAANLGLDLDHPPPSLQAIVDGFRGAALLLRGRAGEALSALDRSARTLSETDWFSQRPLAEAMRARAAVFAGDLRTADQAIEAADAAFAVDPQRSARSLPYIELSRAWTVAGHGAVADAAERGLALATMMEHVAKPLAVEALHAAARLGRPADTVEALRRLRAGVDGPFVPLATRHAEALAQRDADLLTAVGTDFEDLGADLLAAEAHRAASNEHRRQGRGGSAATAARRVDELLERCGHPSSPGLEPVLPLGEEITDREREVALLAAGGRTSAEIAEALFLSVRTVDTHLHRVYRKLQIEGRHQLAQALGVVGAPGDRRGT